MLWICSVIMKVMQSQSLISSWRVWSHLHPYEGWVSGFSELYVSFAMLPFILERFWSCLSTLVNENRTETALMVGKCKGIVVCLNEIKGICEMVGWLICLQSLSPNHSLVLVQLSAQCVAISCVLNWKVPTISHLFSMTCLKVAPRHLHVLAYFSSYITLIVYSAWSVIRFCHFHFLPNIS